MGLISALSAAAFFGYVAVGQTQVQSHGWTPEQWAFIIPIIGLQVVSLVSVYLNRAKTDHVGTKVDAVHDEVRPPSNGVTQGAYIESNAAQLAWLYEEMVHIGRHLGVEPHGPKPPSPLAGPPAEQ